MVRRHLEVSKMAVHSKFEQRLLSHMSLSKIAERRHAAFLVSHVWQLKYEITTQSIPMEDLTKVGSLHQGQRCIDEQAKILRNCIDQGSILNSRTDVFRALLNYFFFYWITFTLKWMFSITDNSIIEALPCTWFLSFLVSSTSPKDVFSSFTWKRGYRQTAIRLWINAVKSFMDRKPWIIPQTGHNYI